VFLFRQRFPDLCVLLHDVPLLRLWEAYSHHLRAGHMIADEQSLIEFGGWLKTGKAFEGYDDD
jgi:hypothetical protein